MRTTFDLIEKGEKLSSKALEDKLNEIRRNFTPSLGKDHGRVVLKSAKLHLEQRLADFCDQLIEHQERVQSELRGQLDKSRQQIVDYYLPSVIDNPPDPLLGQLLEVSKDDARAWLDTQLDRVFSECDIAYTENGVGRSLQGYNF